MSLCGISQCQASTPPPNPWRNYDCVTGADLSRDRSMYLDLSKHVLPKKLLVDDHHFSYESRKFI